MRFKDFAIRFGLAIAVFVASFVLGVVLSGCASETTTAPTPVENVSAPPVAAAPQPAASPTPETLTGTVPAFELTCLPDSTLTVKYNGEASQAQVDTFWTSFDNQELVFGLQTHLVSPGGVVTRSFGQTCIQGDADQPGSKLIGGCFFDIDGKPFIPSRSPEKVTACRNRCVETKEPRTNYGEPVWLESVLEGKCENEVFPIGSDTFTPTLNCHQNGTQAITTDWLCKDDTKDTRNLCRNVACGCVNVPTTREVTVYSEWGECAIVQGLSQRSRTKTVKTYTTNSCTKQEELTDTKTTTEWERCEVGFCHVAANGTPENSNDYGAIKIQTTLFSYNYPEGNPGHNNHLVPTDSTGQPPNSQCPQDFWAIGGLTCNNSTAFAEIKGIASYDCHEVGKDKHVECKYRYYCK